jgi:hypothetical protein
VVLLLSKTEGSHELMLSPTYTYRTNKWAQATATKKNVNLRSMKKEMLEELLYYLKILKIIFMISIIYFTTNCSGKGRDN